MPKRYRLPPQLLTSPRQLILIDGWAAARFLLDRYEGFSKQRQRSLRQLVEQIRHVHGTNIKHVDRFEKICGQLAHNNPNKPPTDEQNVDWFLDSVTEKTYDSVHATCTDKLLDVRWQPLVRQGHQTIHPSLLSTLPPIPTRRPRQ
jgi:hypothetical protein